MVLAVVDDLLFSSKIRAVADRTGQPVAFVRSRAAVLGEVRAQRPRLVIFDLDRAALDPMSAIHEIKNDPDLRAITLVGFVSHVHSDVIDAARRAGIDQVLARSAFVAKLPDLLAPPASGTADESP